MLPGLHDLVWCYWESGHTMQCRACAHARLLNAASYPLGAKHLLSPDSSSEQHDQVYGSEHVLLRKHSSATV